MKVEVLTPSGEVLSTDSPSLVAPAIDGEVGVLDNHAPMLTALGEGVLRLEGVADKYQLKGGILQVGDNKAVILAESAEKLAG